MTVILTNDHSTFHNPKCPENSNTIKPITKEDIKNLTHIEKEDIIIYKEKHELQEEDELWGDPIEVTSVGPFIEELKTLNLKPEDEKKVKQIIIKFGLFHREKMINAI